jgi:hypothetical protein
MDTFPRIASSSETRVEASEDLALMDFRDLAIILITALVLALPMLVYGPMSQGHDTYEHLNFAHHFSEQFWAGEWYPRWLAGMNHGLGSPTLFVYPPLPSYVYTLLEPLAEVFHLDAFKIGEFLCLFGSGICAFLWLNTMIGRRGIAVVGAVLYMLMPYHLAIDYYRRTALSECWALVWIPLVLYFSAKAVRQGGVSLVGVGVAYALLILSHLVSVLMFSLVPLGLAVLMSPRGQEVKSVIRVAGGMLLGVGLSSFYFISALSQAKYFPVSRMPLWSRLEIHILSPGALLHGPGFIHKVTLAATNLIAICIMCSAVILAKGSSESKKKLYFWLLAGAISVWLMSSASLRLWKTSPMLFAAVQYPYRFNIVLCVAALSILAIFLLEISRLPRRSRVLLAILLSVGIAPWLMSYWTIWNRYEGPTAPQQPSVNDYDGWFSAWTAPGLDQASALRATTEPRARFLVGAGTTDVLLWKPRHIEIQTNSPTGGEVVINQFYYPSWRASVLGERDTIAVEAAMPSGLVELNVPPGLQRVLVEIPTGWTERIGQWISGSCVVLSVVFVFGIGRRPKPVLTASRYHPAATSI